jgi:biotin transport system substrate-specific component
MAINVYDRYRYWRYSAFKWRHELSIAKKIGLALGIACLTGLAAQARFYLPWTPVPITGQTFAVLLAGVLLGRWWGGTSQALYAVIGIAGVPWFSGWNGGWAYFTGPTGGYIVGFILAALFVGHFTDSFVNSRRFFPMLGLMLFANFVFIYGLGLLWLNTFSYEAWLAGKTALGLGPYEGRSLLPLLMAGMIPYIVGDVIKVVAAAALTKGIAPKQAYNGELDAGRRWRIP